MHMYPICCSKTCTGSTLTTMPSQLFTALLLRATLAQHKGVATYSPVGIYQLPQSQSLPLHTLRGLQGGYRSSYFRAGTHNQHLHACQPPHDRPMPAGVCDESLFCTLNLTGVHWLDHRLCLFQTTLTWQ
eukprot:1158831-Pelagomonas_calceolata.AAC.8